MQNKAGCVINGRDVKEDVKALHHNEWSSGLCGSSGLGVRSASMNEDQALSESKQLNWEP